MASATQLWVVDVLDSESARSATLIVRAKSAEEAARHDDIGCWAADEWDTFDYTVVAVRKAVRLF